MQRGHLLESGHILMSQLREHTFFYSCQCDLTGKLDGWFQGEGRRTRGACTDWKTWHGKNMLPRLCMQRWKLHKQETNSDYWVGNRIQTQPKKNHLIHGFLRKCSRYNLSAYLHTVTQKMRKELHTQSAGHRRIERTPVSFYPVQEEGV